MNDQDCLAYDPFSGDDTDTSLFADRFVVTRKPHKCNWCLEGIPAGLRVRARTERDNEDNVVMTFYFCPPCCEAMAASSHDNGDAIEARTAMGKSAPQAPQRFGDGTKEGTGDRES